MREHSSPFRGTTILPKISDREVAEQVSAAIIPFTLGQISKASGRTKEAAKKLRGRLNAPNSATLINMARDLDPVRYMLMSLIDPDGIITPRAMTETVRLLSELASGDGEYAVRARQILRGAP